MMNGGDEPEEVVPSQAPAPAQPVQPTPENFGMMLAAVLHIQHTLGEQLATAKNEDADQEQEHLERMETIKILSKTNALVRYGSWLMATMAGGMVYLLLEIHKLEVLLAGLRR